MTMQERARLRGQVAGALLLSAMACGAPTALDVAVDSPLGSLAMWAAAAALLFGVVDLAALTAREWRARALSRILRQSEAAVQRVREALDMVEADPAVAPPLDSLLVMLEAGRRSRDGLAAMRSRMHWSEVEVARELRRAIDSHDRQLGRLSCIIDLALEREVDEGLELIDRERKKRRNA